MNHEYNSQLPHLILKEYGRNIQKIAEYIVKIEDIEERTRYAHTLVELMRQINPNTRDSQDYQNKLWDDLYILSNFNLEVDAPFPMPEKTLLGKKPQRVNYNSNNVKFKHYGKNLELMIKKAMLIEDVEEKFRALVSLARLMKSLYITWNKDNVQDSTILENIEQIARVQLGEAFYERVKSENLLEFSQKDKNKASNSNSGNHPNKVVSPNKTYNNTNKPNLSGKNNNNNNLNKNNNNNNKKSNNNQPNKQQKNNNLKRK